MPTMRTITAYVGVTGEGIAASAPLRMATGPAKFLINGPPSPLVSAPGAGIPSVRMYHRTPTGAYLVPDPKVPGEVG